MVKNKEIVDMYNKRLVMQDKFALSREQTDEMEHGKMPVWMQPSIFPNSLEARY